MPQEPLLQIEVRTEMRLRSDLRRAGPSLRLRTEVLQGTLPQEPLPQEPLLQVELQHLWLRTDVRRCPDLCGCPSLRLRTEVLQGTLPQEPLPQEPLLQVELRHLRLRAEVRGLVASSTTIVLTARPPQRPAVQTAMSEPGKKSPRYKTGGFFRRQG